MRATLMIALLSVAACDISPEPATPQPSATPTRQVDIRVNQPDATPTNPSSGDSVSFEVGPDGLTLEAKKKKKEASE